MKSTARRKLRSTLHTVFTLIAALLLVVACGQKKNETPAQQFMLTNGVCTDTLTGNSVSNTLCGVVAPATALTNGTFFINSEGQCIDSFLNQSVAERYCSSNPFEVQNDVCRDTSTSSTVEDRYCPSLSTGLASGNYRLINGLCVSTTTGQMVQPNLCRGTIHVNGQCFGVYLHGLFGLIHCNGHDCAGETLVEYPGGQQVFCE